MKRVICSMFLLTGTLYSGPLYAQNAVIDWAAIVQPPLNTPAKLPAVQMVLRAMVHIAVYDAVVAIEGGYHPFASAIVSPDDADVRAAVATAAYLTARARVAPSQLTVLDAAYFNYLSAIPDGLPKSRGIAVGDQAAAAVLALRANDGIDNEVFYACSSVPAPPGEFEPNADCGTQPLGVNVGQIRPFTLESADQFRPDGPNPLTSLEYTQDFLETRDFGHKDSTVRTSGQRDIAYFWQTVEIHKGFIDLAIARGLDTRESARFFALVYTAGADANIAGFEAKYFYRFWRPRTAIPLADTDGNPDTEADRNWTPLLSVNHPEYPSAHSYSSTAQMDSIARFFGTNKVTWTLKATIPVPEPHQIERTYDDLNALMREIYDARVWAGLHWRHSMIAGAQVGRKVARHVWDHFFRPIP